MIDHGDQYQFLQHNHYQYDSFSREVATWRDEQANKGERFYYSPTNQLTNVRYNADQVWTGNPVNWDRWVDYGYTPDTLNRSHVNDNGTNFSWYGASALNQYTSVGGQTLSYDGNFNLTGYNGASFIYNSAGQLTLASKGGNSVQFTYDGLGRCVRRTVNGVARLFTYDGWKPMLEFDGAGNFLHWNMYGAGPDEILARNDGLFYKQDQRGNVVALLGTSNNILEKYTYDAFGTPTITDASGNVRAESAYGNRFMFTGREYIKELGIYDFRFRHYQPELGRFLQKDPIGFAAGDANLFRYCGGDPVNRSDPLGLAGKNNPPAKQKQGPEGVVVHGDYIHDQNTDPFDPTKAFFEGAIDWGPFGEVMHYLGGGDHSGFGNGFSGFGDGPLGSGSISLGPSLPSNPFTPPQALPPNPFAPSPSSSVPSVPPNPISPSPTHMNPTTEIPSLVPNYIAAYDHYRREGATNMLAGAGVMALGGAAMAIPGGQIPGVIVFGAGFTVSVYGFFLYNNADELAVRDVWHRDW